MEDIIVLYPSPGRGHLVPMVELGKQMLTHHPNFSVTIIISHPPFQDSLTSSYIATFSTAAANSSISFLHLPAVPLPPDSPRDNPTLTFEFTRLNNSNLRQALVDLSESNSKIIKAFVIDFFCNAAFEVSASLNIPTYYFIPCGANGLAAFLYSPTIHNHYTKSLKDLEVFIHVPGLPSMPSYQMPMLMLDRNRKVYQYFIETATQMSKSAGLVVNTFEALEPSAIRAIRDSRCTPGVSVPPLYCIGPLIAENQNAEESHACLSWLDSQPRQSIVFLSFGSMGKFNAKQLKEIAIGLDSSGVRFLWVVRDTPPDDPTRISMEYSGGKKLEAFLPEGFLERTRDRGMVVKSWAPQVEVLNHDSVGGFVTHCGWNSILEAICAGVPMLAWPLYAEQKVNRAFLVEEIQVALSVAEMRDGSVSGAELKERLTELMDSEKGQEIRDRVMSMREHGLNAQANDGPSLVALTQLVQSFKHV